MSVTANQIVRKKGENTRQHYGALAAKHFYQDTLVFVNRTSGSGEGYATDVINSGANNFAGIAEEEVDNSSGSSGDKNVVVWNNGRFLLTGSGFGQHLVGEAAYASDNFTVTASSTNTTRIGTFKQYVSSTQMWVEIETEAPAA